MFESILEFIVYLLWDEIEDDPLDLLEKGSLDYLLEGLG
ncbi:hypothetical protein BQ9231_00052 [Cedratvirus lausannensis]|uniref:Uncharacterized protein n=1 Tax=Cedratvirus lausannensis TaxID=2023205 RepID=A0A285Q164_9VIRU|nr:hypothetical protein BQ9231_00052 [Cedratvirus lausannensis]